jgi:hypothetical protein
MNGKRRLCVGLVLFLLLCPFRAKGFSEEQMYFSKFEFLTGYGTSRILDKERYRVTPFLFDFNFDLRPWLEKHKIHPPGLSAFVLEPFISYAFSPNNNVEVGNNFAIKIGFLPETSKFQPYFKGGSGPMFMSLHTHEQGSQFNFNDFAGLGLHYFFKKSVALTLEYRFRHVSNANLTERNKGLEGEFGLCGMSFLF